MTIESYFTEECYSPYRVAKILQSIVGKTINPQMIYNYISNNMIKAHKNELNKWVVTRKDAIVWVTKYVNRNHAELAKQLVTE